MDLQNQGLVFIADPVSDHKDIDLYSKNLECPDMHYYNSALEQLQRLSSNVTCYEHPKDFIDNIAKHKDDIVISIWSGSGSKNRKSTVPIICEAYGIRYSGSDAYTHFLSQDKFLSKIYSKEFDVDSSRGIHIRREKDIATIKDLTFPLIIKPNSEGGSNGISQKNVVQTYDDAVAVCQELLPHFQNDIIAEEFIMGTEITTVLIGTRPDNLIFKQNRLDFSSGNPYEIWGFETKKREDTYVPLKPADILDDAAKETIQNLYFSFGKPEYMRIDGRVTKEGKFYLLELTPDASLEPGGSIHMAVSQAGGDYLDMFRILVENTIDFYEHHA